MIPPFDDQGYLPAGLHLATLDEVAERFGGPSELRQAQMESVRWLVELAKAVGITRLVVNGSFSTDQWEPNDVDCVLLTSPDFPRDRQALEELDEGLPFLDIEMVDQPAFDRLTNEMFATDRLGNPKGMVEVRL